MEPKPKERIVFDEDSYYGDEGENPVNPARMAAYQKARMKIPPAVTRWSSSTIPRITGSS